MEKVLITGGSGFLGINLVRYLLAKKKYKIIVYDFADFNYPEKKDIVFIKKDIRNKKDMFAATKGVDFVIHCAAALPLYSKEDIFSTDIMGTRNVASAAFEYKVKRLVHISSTAVYGVPDHHPIYETDKRVGVGPYGIAKIKAENVCEEFREKGMTVSILRPKSFIGPERLGIFAMLYDWAKDGKGFPLLGRGKNLYQLLDVEDFCRLIHLCLVSPKKAVNDTYNVGAKEFKTLKRDFQSVLDYAGFKKKIVMFPAKPAVLALRFLEFFKLAPVYEWIYETAYRESFVSIKKAEKNLKFTPKYSNKDALLRNYDWYLANLKTFKKQKGVSHRVPWSQGILKVVKWFF